VADLGISEFTFGFAFLYEQTLKKWGSIRSAPILPSLLDEADKGWDAKIPTKGKDYYYQFKLSELLSRPNAKYIAEGSYLSPYYRIKLHKAHSNQQHRRLWEHARRLGNEHTYYVAPELSSKEDFNTAFLSNTVTESSRLIPLRDCDNYNLTDEKQHYITYQGNATGFEQHSEPLKKTGSFSGKELKEIYEGSKNKFLPIDDRFADSLLKRTVGSLDELTHEDYSKEIEKVLEEKIPETKIEKLLLSSKILAVAYGATLVIVGENEGN
jgi:hypothetical protein